MPAGHTPSILRHTRGDTPAQTTAAFVDSALPLGWRRWFGPGRLVVLFVLSVGLLWLAERWRPAHAWERIMSHFPGRALAARERAGSGQFTSLYVWASVPAANQTLPTCTVVEEMGSWDTARPMYAGEAGELWTVTRWSTHEQTSWYLPWRGAEAVQWTVRRVSPRQHFSQAQMPGLIIDSLAAQSRDADQRSIWATEIDAMRAGRATYTRVDPLLLLLNVAVTIVPAWTLVNMLAFPWWIRRAMQRRRMQTRCAQQRCPFCGYDLGSQPLSVDAPRCPECGRQGPPDALHPHTPTAL